MEERITIDVSRLDPDGETFAGEADIIDLNEELVKPFGGVRYRLFAQAIGSELLVKGSLEQDFTLACSRCGKDFDETIRVDDFLTSVEIGPETEVVDLTDETRECIILTLPAYPVCDEACSGIEQEQDEPVDDRWAGLDQLNIKQGDNENGKS